jgi:hypothetical protein
VVVRVDRAAEPLRRERREDLVGVHVRRRAGAGLEDVDREVLVPAALGDLRGRLLHRAGQRLLQHAERGVDLGGGGLDARERLDVGPLDALPADREVLHARWVCARYFAS